MPDELGSQAGRMEPLGKDDVYHAPPTLGSRLALVGAWTVVGLPALWAIAQVVVKSRALFR